MDNQLKQYLSEFIANVEKYVTQKNEELKKQEAWHLKILAEIKEAQISIDRKKKELETLHQQKEYFDKEKTLFDDKVKQFQFKEKQLEEKAKRIQSMFNE